MELLQDVLKIDTFLAVTLGIIVLFVGKRINDSVRWLREFGIPEPVTGGLLFSVIFALIYLVTGIGVEFDLKARDFLLVYFFTTIGINASFQDLARGGKPLLILLALTIAYMFVQNLTGTSVAALLEQPKEVGLIGGTVSLIGGHGTAIAWAPRFAEQYGITNALEIGIACATFGLILASAMGGPIAKLLISRYQLRPEKMEPLDVGVTSDRDKPKVNYLDVLDAILAIHICIILGLFLNHALKAAGLALPDFVTCLFAGILVTNLAPPSAPRITGRPWPSKQPAIALISDIALGTFLAMSLMSLQLWNLVDLAGPIFAILGVQALVTVFYSPVRGVSRNGQEL